MKSLKFEEKSSITSHSIESTPQAIKGIPKLDLFENEAGSEMKKTNIFMNAPGQRQIKSARIQMYGQRRQPIRT